VSQLSEVVEVPWGIAYFMPVVATNVNDPLFDAHPHPYRETQKAVKTLTVQGFLRFWVGVNFGAHPLASKQASRSRKGGCGCASLSPARFAFRLAKTALNGLVFSLKADLPLNPKPPVFFDGICCLILLAGSTGMHD